MSTNAELTELYKSFETCDLLEIVSNKDDWTPLAYDIALKELKHRKLPDEDINKYQSVLKYRHSEQLLKNYLLDLNIIQKMILYIIWVPKVRRYFTYDFMEKDYVLKEQQANYYWVCGIVAFISSMFLSLKNFNNFFVIWGIGFAIAFLFDLYYNKKRQCTELQRKMSEGKDLWDPFR